MSAFSGPLSHAKANISRLDKTTALAQLAAKLNALERLEAEVALLKHRVAELTSAPGEAAGAGTATGTPETFTAVAADAHHHAGAHADEVDKEALEAGPPGSAAYRRAHKNALADRIRCGIQLEHTYHQLHRPFDIAEIEALSTAEARTRVEKAELLVEMQDAEMQRRKSDPASAPLYSELPDLVDTDIEALRDQHDRVMCVWQLYQLTSHPKIARLHDQALAYTVDTPPDELAAALHKAQLLKDVVTHLRDLQLVGKEKDFDLSTPTADVEKLWQETHADHTLLRRFKKCSMCSKRHAPRRVLLKHPHLNLVETGRTHLGGNNCCVSCAPYWD